MLTPLRESAAAPATAAPRLCDAKPSRPSPCHRTERRLPSLLAANHAAAQAGSVLISMGYELLCNARGGILSFSPVTLCRRQPHSRSDILAADMREAYVARSVNLSGNRQSQESLQNKGPRRRNVSRRPSIGSCFRAILPHGYLGTPRNCEPHFSSMRCSNAGMCTCLILVLQFVSLVTYSKNSHWLFIPFHVFTFFKREYTQTRIYVAF